MHYVHLRAVISSFRLQIVLAKDCKLNCVLADYSIFLLNPKLIPGEIVHFHHEHGKQLSSSVEVAPVPFSFQLLFHQTFLDQFQFSFNVLDMPFSIGNPVNEIVQQSCLILMQLYRACIMKQQITDTIS